MPSGFQLVYPKEREDKVRSGYLFSWFSLVELPQANGVPWQKVTELLKVDSPCPSQLLATFPSPDFLVLDIVTALLPQGPIPCVLFGDFPTSGLCCNLILYK